MESVEIYGSIDALVQGIESGLEEKMYWNRHGHLIASVVGPAMYLIEPMEPQPLPPLDASED